MRKVNGMVVLFFGVLLGGVIVFKLDSELLQERSDRIMELRQRVRDLEADVDGCRGSLIECERVESTFGELMDALDNRHGHLEACGALRQ